MSVEMPVFFQNLPQIKARALYLGESLNLKIIDSTEKLSEHPLIIPAGNNGFAALFRYGVAVLFNLTPIEEASFRNYLTPFLAEPFSDVEIEDCRIQLSAEEKEGVKNSTVYLAEYTIERLQVIASAISKSVVLSQYEKKISTVFDKIEPLATKLQQGRFIRNAKFLLRHIGSILQIQYTMVGRVEITEKPEFLWDIPELERLYFHIEKEYELKERHVALERKFNLISYTAETLLDLLQHQSSMRVEWYIVIIILFELIISLYNLYRGVPH